MDTADSQLGLNYESLMLIFENRIRGKKFTIGFCFNLSGAKIALFSRG